MSEDNPAAGIVTGMLGVSFVVLKLTDVIDWSWWWVTAPFWVPLVFGLIGVALILVADKLADRKSK